MKLLLLLGFCAAAIFAKKGFGPGEQEWGHINIRKGAHMFYWLYYTTAAVENVTERPLIIWLQGGPGSSSTGYGNFGELGPLDYNLNERNTTWVKDANIIFVDNPVGTGFSYVENAEFAKNNTQVAKDFLIFMKGFYKENPIFRKIPLYIVSESYGGKMTAEIALILYQAISRGELDGELKGIGLGDSWISPIDSVNTWADYLLQLGLVYKNGYDMIKASARQTQDALDKGSYVEATNKWAQTEQIIYSVTWGVDFYNVLKKTELQSNQLRIDTVNTDLESNKFKILTKGIFKPAADEDKLIDDIMNIKVKKALNISTSFGKQANAVFDNMSEDFMKPVTHIVEELLNTTDIKVFVYNGQLDLIVDTPGTVKWVDNLNWKSSSTWKSQTRSPIVINGFLEGYEKKLDNLAMIWVNRAGHMVPSDNPDAMHYILRTLTNDFSV